MMSFGEYVMMKSYNVNDSYTMQHALKKYAVYEEKIWCIETAAKYFELPETSWDGWDWELDEDGAMLEDYSFPTAPWHIFQENPLTGELWTPCEDVPAIICEWGLAGNSVDEKNAFLHDVHIPGYNHGWDESALEKEQRMAGLHDWGLRAWAEDFYENIQWAYEVLNKYDRTEGLLNWARSLPEKTDHDLEWSERERKKATNVCDFAEQIQEMIDSEDYTFASFPTEFSTYDMKDAQYGTFDKNNNWNYVAYYTVSDWYIDYAGDKYYFGSKGWKDNKVPSKEIKYFAVKAICMEYAEMFGLSK